MSEISNQLFGKKTVWRDEPEDPGVVRWVTRVQLPDRRLDVNLCVAEQDDHRQRILETSVVIRKLSTRLEANIAVIVAWYLEHHGQLTAAKFRRQLKTKNNLFVDFTESPTRRQWEFYGTDMQHLGVPIGEDGEIPSW